MAEIFADTNFWVALGNPKDSLYEISQYFGSDLEHLNIVTSEIVLSEILEITSADPPHFKAQTLGFIGSLIENRSIIIEPMSPKLFEETVQFYRRHIDKDWGFADCSSFVIMKSRGIREALTYDRHFIQAGFKALLRNA